MTSMPEVVFSAGPSSCASRNSATNDRVAEEKARKLIQDDQVDVLLGGILSSTRQAIRRQVVAGQKLYIYPEHYEGRESHPLIFCTGPCRGTAAGAVHSVADAANGGEEIPLSVC